MDLDFTLEDGTRCRLQEIHYEVEHTRWSGRLIVNGLSVATVTAAGYYPGDGDGYHELLDEAIHVAKQERLKNWTDDVPQKAASLDALWDRASRFGNVSLSQGHSGYTASIGSTHVVGETRHEALEKLIAAKDSSK